ncbi:MAG: GldG family protein [Spirochaetes bacterium]|nr:GldG family protein [Spirochaetota bacterium]
MQKNKTKEIILITLTSVIFILLAMNSTVFFNRIDLTENRAFTISKATRQIIASLPDRVHITYFISDKIRTITPVAQEIEDILQEYAARSRGRISVVSIDPAAVPGMAARAESLGVIPRHIEVFSRSERSIAAVYSGIVIQYMDEFETIPFTLSLETLEFDVTHRIRRLVEGIDVNLGLIIGDNRRSIEAHYSFLFDRIDMTYNIELLRPGHEIPPAISVLAVIGNRDLTEDDLFFIDEYIMNGGRVLFGVNGVDVDLMANFAVTQLENNPTIEMLKKHGITVNNDLVHDKSARRIPIRGAFFPILYPQWISLLGQNVSSNNPITSRFTGLDLMWASSITIEEKEGLTYERLLATTDQAWTFDTNLSAAPEFVGSLMSFVGDDQRQIGVGYVVSGTFRSAFTDRTSPNTRIIVISDSNFASDIIEFSDSPYNLAFFENAIEWLSNDESLLQIKTRARRDMRLNRIEAPERRAAAIRMVYLVNIVIIPLSIIAFAIVRFIRRKKRET